MHNEEVKNEVKLNIEELKKKIQTLPKNNPCDFTENVEKQKEDNERDLGLFLELAKENKIIYNQTPANTLIEDVEKLRRGFCTVGYFSLSDKEEFDTNRFFRDINELAKFRDKILDKYDDHPSIYYTGNIYRYFRKFKRVAGSNHERRANEFDIIQEYEGINCYITKGNGCFLKFLNYLFKRVLVWSISNSYNRIKEEQML